MGWMTGIRFLVWGWDFFFLAITSRPTRRPTQPPIQWVLGALSLGVKWLGCEADLSPPSIAKVKNAQSYTSTPQYDFMAWCLIKQWICLHGMVLR
jgi:hypothetical protein